MKKLIYLFLLLLSASFVYGVAPNFVPYNITDRGAGSIYAIDLDKDNDIDILAADAWFGVGWYENNGTQDFTYHLITSPHEASDVFPVDMDADNDLDVVYSSNGGPYGEVGWAENDGNQNFTIHPITYSVRGALSVTAVDLDKDTDIDILSANYIDGDITWYVNDGNQSFSIQRIGYSPSVRSILAKDIDNDNDVDLISSGYEVAWYENNGNQTFTKNIISETESVDVFAIDIDQDGDIDIISSGNGQEGYPIGWYENNGTQGFTFHAIHGQGEFAFSVFAIDLDQDGDIDILSADLWGGIVAWYENDGNEFFTSHIIDNQFGAQGIFAIDIDQDGDIDIISSWSSGFVRITWYENLIISNCTNGEKDGDETDVDCGGSCPPCMNCNNRIQDGDEEGLDCGGSCPEPCHRLKILAVPLTWVTPQQEFEQAVDKQIDFFINATQLSNCRENVKVNKLSVKNKFSDFSCNRSTCGVSKIKPYVESLGINTEEYDHIIGFAEFSPGPCGAGCSNGKDVAWVTTTYDIVAAHEIGHFYGLEDEYCSNQAGSSDIRCNDGNEPWWKNAQLIQPTDINYLGTDLGCDPHIGDCCSNCSKEHNPKNPDSDCFACCEGNINSKGGRDIMSYTNADGPRDFDNRSKTHLDSFPRLQCTSPLEAMMMGAVENKIIDVNLLVYNNDSVEKRWIWLADGSPSVALDDEGNYNLLVKDINGNTLFNHSLEMFFDYSGPMVKGENYSGIFFDSMELSLRVQYDSNMYKLELQHNQTIIFSEILNFCNLDGTCNGSETYLSCWQDCKSYSKDGICLNYTEDGCDPDCAKWVDLDCNKYFNVSLIKGWNLVSIPLDLLDKHVDSIFDDVDIYGYNGSWFIPTEIDNKLGYWLKINESKNITLSGTEIEYKTIELNQGWNLIGYPSLNTTLINESLNDINYSVVYGYDNSWRSYVPFRDSNSLEHFIPGYGYWLYSNEDLTLVIE